MPDPTTAQVRVGQVWEHETTGLQLRITQVPGGRKRTYRTEYVNPTCGGNGRPPRGDRKLHGPGVLFRRYTLVKEAPE